MIKVRIGRKLMSLIRVIFLANTHINVGPFSQPRKDIFQNRYVVLLHCQSITRLMYEYRANVSKQKTK